MTECGFSYTSDSSAGCHLKLIFTKSNLSKRKRKTGSTTEIYAENSLTGIRNKGLKLPSLTDDSIHHSNGTQQVQQSFSIPLVSTATTQGIDNRPTFNKDDMETSISHAIQDMLPDKLRPLNVGYPGHSVEVSPLTF